LAFGIFETIEIGRTYLKHRHGRKKKSGEIGLMTGTGCRGPAEKGSKGQKEGGKKDTESTKKGKPKTDNESLGVKKGGGKGRDRGGPKNGKRVGKGLTGNERQKGGGTSIGCKRPRVKRARRTGEHKPLPDKK